MRGERSISIAKEPDITHTDGVLREVSKVRGPSHTHGIRNEVYRRHGINRNTLSNLVGASHAISDDEGHLIDTALHIDMGGVWRGLVGEPSPKSQLQKVTTPCDWSVKTVGRYAQAVSY